MKKRITLALALVAVISLSACGANGETTETTTEAVQEQTTAAEKSETTEKTEAVTEEITTAEQIPELTYTISETCYLKHGTWTFKATASDNTTQYYFTNIKTKETFAPKCKFSAAEHNFAGNLAIIDDCIYNAKTGDMLIDCTDESTFVLYPFKYNESSFSKSTLCVMKKNSSFSDTSYEIGFIDSNGEWLKPMTSDCKLFDIPNFEPGWCFNDNGEYLIYINPNDKTNYFYNIQNDQLIDGTAINGGLSLAAHPYGSDYVGGFDSDSNLIVFDLKNGCIATTIPWDPYGGITKSESFVGPNDNIVYNDFLNTGNYKVIDLTTNTISKFDLTKYSYSEVFLGTENFVFACVVKEDTYYMGLFDQNGDPISEPFTGYSQREYDSFLSSDDIIVCVDSSANFLYNIKTKELTMGNTDESSADFYRICDFDAETNTLLVQAKNPDDGNIYYYLADANDPMNYYNPLEK